MTERVCLIFTCVCAHVHALINLPVPVHTNVVVFWLCKESHPAPQQETTTTKGPSVASAILLFLFVIFVAAPLPHCFSSACVRVCVYYLWWWISDSVLAGGRAKQAGHDEAALSEKAEYTSEHCWTLALGLLYVCDTLRSDSQTSVEY